MSKEEVIKCEMCCEILKPSNVVWLELSNTDGKYYKAIPEGHESQGDFPFGLTCSAKQLIETNKK
jgi:hypothetical protein